jgi:membrane-bound inhibitor of C-type lysozyme
MRSIAFIAVTWALSACSSVNLWPFGGEQTGELSRAPANAIEYQCNNGRRFYARYLDNGASVWVIFPEREFRLDKVESASVTRYTNRQAILEANEAGEISLRDGATIAFTGCTAGGAKPQPPKPEPEKAAPPKD